MIEVRNLTASYGRIVAIRNVTLAVSADEIVCLLGANGAGKTTLLRTISGLHPPDTGSIRYDSADLAGLSAAARVKRGLVQVPEGRRVFGPLSVEDNLELGGITLRPSRRRQTMAEIFDLFPVLAERRKAQAGSLSGGEQQMLAIGRAMMAAPRLLLLDEPSLGLAPKMVATIFALIRRLNDQGTAILVVEQNAAAALSIAHRGYVLETGQMVRTGTAEELMADDAVREAYLGA